MLRGHVKYQMEGIGLGVEFEGLTEEEQTTIGDIVEFSTVERASAPKGVVSTLSQNER